MNSESALRARAQRPDTGQESHNGRQDHELIGSSVKP
jgi:hypothetical protein